MGERVADHLDHFAVEFNIAAFEIDQHLLAEFIGQIAHQPGERAEQRFNPLHAHAGDRIAYIGQDRGEPFKRAINGWLCSSLA